MSKESVAKTNPASQAEDELEKRMRKAGLIANSVSYLVFGALFLLIAQSVYHYGDSLEVIALAVTAFVVIVTIANFTIYRHYKHQMFKGEV